VPLWTRSRPSEPNALVKQLRTIDERLDAAGDLLERAHRELAAVAEEVVRPRLPEGTCGAPWAVCSHCPGVGLTASAGSSWCPSCGRLGPPGSERPTYLCIERASVTVRDATGAEAAMCVSHAAGALRRVDRLSVVAATADDVRRLVAALDRPLRIDVSGQSSLSNRGNVPERT